jgi:hypothetical protein
VLGSTSVPPTAETAWINHYHHKSEEEYFAKAARKSVLDQVGIKFQNRTAERRVETEQKQNAILDTCAIEYLALRRHRGGPDSQPTPVKHDIRLR